MHVVMINEVDFIELAKKELSNLFEIFDNADQNYDLDLDFSGEVLKVTSKIGCYVINRNIAAKEIWLSSPSSGPYHFEYKFGDWVTSSGIEMRKILQQEFEAIGIKIFV